MADIRLEIRIKPHWRFAALAYCAMRLHMVFPRGLVWLLAKYVHVYVPKQEAASG